MKIISSVKYVFTILGLVMLYGTYYLYNNTQQFLDKAQVAQGTVIDLHRSRTDDSTVYYPIIRFKMNTDKQVEFTASSGSNPPSYKRGEQLEILYAADEPEQAKINSFFSIWGGIAIVGFISSIFTLVGCSLFFCLRRKAREIKYLKRHGLPVRAKIKQISINTGFSEQGRNPYSILLQWQNPSTSEIHLFTSEPIWFDPTDYIDEEKLTVLINKDKPESYYIDLSFLPKMAG